MKGSMVRIHPLHPSLTKKTEWKERAKEAFSDYSADDGSRNVTRPDMDKDVVIESLLEALQLQKERRALANDSSYQVIKLLHALSLEYKSRLLFDKAMNCLQESLFLIDEELKIQPQGIESQSAASHASAKERKQKLESWENIFMATIESSSTSLSKLQTLITVPDGHTKEASQAKSKIILLLEEKSKILLGLGNVMKLRGKKRDAIDSYTDALLALTDAGHTTDSSQAAMITRLINRLEPKDNSSTGEKSL